MNLLLELIAQHSELKTRLCLQKLLSGVSKLLGNQFYDLFIAFEPNRIQGKTLTLDNYPSAEESQCNRNRYAQLESMIRYSKTNTMPLSWTQQQAANSEFEPPVCCSASNGISIPIHGLNGELGMLSLTSSSQWIAKEDNDLALAQLVVPLITQNLSLIAASLDSGSDTISLTEREKQCLTLAADGKSSSEIANTLGCSERTIKFHLSNASQKLGATNRCQAITKAILGGHIEPVYI